MGLVLQAVTVHVMGLNLRTDIHVVSVICESYVRLSGEKSEKFLLLSFAYS